MSKNYSGFKKGYLNKGERIAYAKTMQSKQQCQMINCTNMPENMGYCLKCFPKNNKMFKRVVE